METRTLGKSGPDISVVGYGAWEAGGAMWGGPVSDETVLDAMRAAIDSGTTWIDTAEAYGDGRSEELVGKILGERPDVMVFTKVAPFISGNRPDEVKKAVRGSLRRLGRDVIDLYQVHWPDEENVPVEDTWGAMADLQDEGLVRHIGVSNFDRGLVERCLTIRHVDSVQNQFSLLHLDDADELLPWLSEQGVGYLGYAPLAFGLLTGSVTTETEFGPDDWRSGSEWDLGYYQDLFAPGRLERSIERVERLRPLAERAGVPLATLALRAALETPGVTGVIAGSRKPDHVRANAAAGDLVMDESVVSDIMAKVA